MNKTFKSLLLFLTLSLLHAKLILCLIYCLIQINNLPFNSTDEYPTGKRFVSLDTLQKKQCSLENLIVEKKLILQNFRCCVDDLMFSTGLQLSSFDVLAPNPFFTETLCRQYILVP